MLEPSPSPAKCALRRRTGLILISIVLAGCSAIPDEDEPAPKTEAVATTDGAAGKPPKSSGALIGERPGIVTGKPYVPSNRDPSPFRFRDIIETSGIDFVHFSAMTDEKYFPSANGSGVALFDYDGDGLLDIYLATCTDLPLGTGKTVRSPNKLYKNLGGGKFQDVTARSKLGFRGFCNGITCGDIDNDGDIDVFLSNYGNYTLFENLGDGTFKDITKSAGVEMFFWSSGGAFLDYDNDGDLDLYVANYGKWVYPEDDKFCGDKDKGVRFYCTPSSITTVRHILFRNNGDKTFTDVTAQAGVERAKGEYGHGFGVVTCDLNGDGLIDIYVANDMNPNFLFLNNGNGTFRDATLTAGAAFDESGKPRSGMGVDAEDVDGDGRPDLFVTNFANEPNTLYMNLGGAGFMDSTSNMGLASDSMPFVGWGCALADFDNDGRPDSFVTNGHVDDNLKKLGREVDYEQPALLCRNIDGVRFKLSTYGAGPYFEAKHVGRGAAFGDLDNDGDMDIVVNHRDGRPGILINETPTKNHWLRIVLKGTKSNREGIGARIEVDTGKLVLERQRKGGVSMSSANDPRVLVGVGEVDVLPRVSIFWPSGVRQDFTNVKTNQTLTAEEPPKGP